MNTMLFKNKDMKLLTNKYWDTCDHITLSEKYISFLTDEVLGKRYPDSGNKDPEDHTKFGF